MNATIFFIWLVASGMGCASAFFFFLVSGNRTFVGFSPNDDSRNDDRDDEGGWLEPLGDLPLDLPPGVTLPGPDTPEPTYGSAWQEEEIEVYA